MLHNSYRYLLTQVYCFLVHCSKGKYARVILEAGGWEWFQSLLQVGAGTGL